MAGALFRPPTPEMEEVDDDNDGNHDDVQVEEEAFVEVRTEGGALMATPFFSQESKQYGFRTEFWTSGSDFLSGFPSF